MSRAAARDNRGTNVSGINVNQTRKISWLSSDDTVLFGENKREEQHQVDALHEYLEGLGMIISRGKSQTFQMIAKRDT